MAFIKIENGTVVQKQTYHEDGFVEVPDHVECGMIQDGSEFIASPPQYVVPQRVTMRQARLALLQAGLLQQVTDAVASIGGAAAIEWEYSTTVRRDSPLVQSISSGLGLLTQQMDELFTLAATL
jgi:hypothetical protein